MQKFPVVKVTWLDSGTMWSEGWQKTQAILDAAPVTLSNVVTVGHLIMSDNETVVVGLSYDEANDAFYSVQVIAAPSVLEMTVLS